MNRLVLRLTNLCGLASLALTLLGVVLFLTSPAGAQEISSIRISTEPTGVKYLVDGNPYYQPTVFLWPKGSKHVVSMQTPYINRDGLGVCSEAGSIAVQYDEFCTSRYTFGGWSTNLGSGGAPGATVHVVTADPAITTITGTFSVEHRVWVAMYERINAPNTAPCEETNHLGDRPFGAGPGVVFIGGRCVPHAQGLWLAPGDYDVTAIPYDGYAFRGWSLAGNVNSSYLTKIRVGGPMTIHPMFEPAKRVRLYTNPPELQLRVDRQVINTMHPQFPSNARPVPGYFDWLKDTTHILGAPSPQTDRDGKAWVFEKWSNGGGQDMRYNTGNELAGVEVLTAIFARGVSSSVITQPAGLKVKVDGRENYPVNTYTWAVGSKFTVSAPLEQLDSTGRKYTFKRWSNDGGATQEISVTEGDINPGIRLIAEYEALPQVTLRSSVPGLKIKVDGVDCSAPCKLDRPSGTSVRISVPEVLPISEVSRSEFTGWHDGGPAERTIVFDRDAQSLLANYRMANRLIAISDPEEGAVFRMSPEAADGFYPANAVVSVTVEPKPGFRFRRWDGDLAGSFRSGSVEMGLSRIVRASLERVPFVSAAGVRNAAGITPIAGVAAGSLVSIYGASLAQVTEATPGSNLSQMLGNVAVFSGDRLLPLVYVSPEQINAQIPSDFSPGKYSLTIRPAGLPEVSVEFEVVRNAPGLFGYLVDGVNFAIALHEDGSPVNAASPAKKGEMLTLTGTGFGPYDRRLIDGFSTPASPQFNLADRAEAHVAGRIVTPEWTGAQPGLPGIVSVKLRLGDVPSGPQELKIVVNGAESNTVVVPVE